MPTAEIICADALGVLSNGMGDPYPAIFTSLPDAAELDLPVPQWRDWFRLAAERTLLALSINGGYALFYQTDRRYKGGIEDKGYMIARTAVRLGARVIFHRIAVQSMTANRYRPTYSHFICVGYGKPRGAVDRPDVYMQGPKAYPDATDETTCAMGVEFLARQGISDVHDPFCGRGSILYYAMREGFDVYGIDIDPEQVRATCDLLGQPALL